VKKVVNGHHMNRNRNNERRPVVVVACIRGEAGSTPDFPFDEEGQERTVALTEGWKNFG
jgi:hypothetical protein